MSRVTVKNRVFGTHRTMIVTVATLAAWSVPASAQTPKAPGKQLPEAVAPKPAPSPAPASGAGASTTTAPAGPTRANLLRGEYGRYRNNNDLLYYHLDVRVDPETQTIGGKNTIRFRMLQDDNRIQLDLQPALATNKILWGEVPLKFERELGAVFVDFPDTLKAGEVHSIDFYYSGKPSRDGTLRRDGIRQGPGRPALDLHIVRGTRSELLVAQQGPVARRGRVDGPERHGSERSHGRLQRQVR